MLVTSHQKISFVLLISLVMIDDLVGRIMAGWRLAAGEFRIQSQFVFRGLHFINQAFKAWHTCSSYAQDITMYLVAYPGTLRRSLQQLYTTSTYRLTLAPVPQFYRRDITPL